MEGSNFRLRSTRWPFARSCRQARNDPVLQRPDRFHGILFGIPMTEPVGKEIDYAMLRRNASSTVFARVQEPWRESTRSNIAAVKQLPVMADNKRVANHEAYAMLTTQDCQRCHFAVRHPQAKSSGCSNFDRPGNHAWTRRHLYRLWNQLGECE